MPDGRTVASRVPSRDRSVIYLAGCGHALDVEVELPAERAGCRIASSKQFYNPRRTFEEYRAREVPYVGASVEVVGQYADVEVMPCHEYPDGACSRWPWPELQLVWTAIAPSTKSTVV
jgi:hypothetical protein